MQGEQYGRDDVWDPLVKCDYQHVGDLAGQQLPQHAAERGEQQEQQWWQRDERI